MKGIFFQGSIFSRQIFPCKNFFPSKSVCGIFFFLKSPIPHHPSPPQKSNGRPLKLRLRRTGAMRSTGPELDPVSVFFFVEWNNWEWRPLDSRTRTTTSTRFDYRFFSVFSQLNRDTLESFMVLLIHQKSTVIFIEGGHSPLPIAQW